MNIQGIYGVLSVDRLPYTCYSEKEEIMKSTSVLRTLVICAIIVSILAVFGPKGPAAHGISAGDRQEIEAAGSETYYYAVKIRDVVGGYIKFLVSEKTTDSGEIILLNEYFFIVHWPILFLSKLKS